MFHIFVYIGQIAFDQILVTIGRDTLKQSVENFILQHKIRQALERVGARFLFHISPINIGLLSQTFAS